MNNLWEGSRPKSGNFSKLILLLKMNLEEISNNSTACQRCVMHDAGHMTSRDVISLLPVTISLVTIYN